MKLMVTDYNGAGSLIRRRHASAWAEVEAVLTSMPVPLKGSDQAGKVGSLIFSPVAANAHVTSALTAHGWSKDEPIPSAQRHLGLHVDLWKSGVITELQFSNYPFLLNNVLRTEVLMRDGVQLSGNCVQLLVVVTKAHRLPASNSTLYYEQAVPQLNDLARLGLFSVPVRLVGLTADLDEATPAAISTFHTMRYSRTSTGMRVLDVVLRAEGGEDRARIEEYRR